MLNPEDQVYIDLLDYEGGLYENHGIAILGLLPGMVPPFEENSARRKAGYTIHEWHEIGWMDRAIEVAMFRIENKVEAIMNEKMKDEARMKK